MQHILFSNRPAEQTHNLCLKSESNLLKPDWSDFSSHLTSHKLFVLVQTREPDTHTHTRSIQFFISIGSNLKNGSAWQWAAHWDSSNHQQRMQIHPSEWVSIRVLCLRLLLSHRSRKKLLTTLFRLMQTQWETRWEKIDVVDRRDGCTENKRRKFFKVEKKIELCRFTLLDLVKDITRAADRYQTHTQHIYVCRANIEDDLPMRVSLFAACRCLVKHLFFIILTSKRSILTIITRPKMKHKRRWRRKKLLRAVNTAIKGTLKSFDDNKTPFLHTTVLALVPRLACIHVYYTHVCVWTILTFSPLDYVSITEFSTFLTNGRNSYSIRSYINMHDWVKLPFVMLPIINAFPLYWKVDLLSAVIKGRQKSTAIYIHTHVRVHSFAYT